MIGHGRVEVNAAGKTVTLQGSEQADNAPRVQARLRRPLSQLQNHGFRHLLVSSYGKENKIIPSGETKSAEAGAVLTNTPE